MPQLVEAPGHGDERAYCSCQYICGMVPIYLTIFLLQHVRMRSKSLVLWLRCDFTLYPEVVALPVARWLPGLLI